MKVKIFTTSILFIMMILSIIYSNSINSSRIKYINKGNILNDSLVLITKDSIISYLKILNLVKDSMTTREIDLNRIENSINEIKYVKNSNAYFGINSNLKINIIEREPLVEINDKDVYLDCEGKMVPKSILNKPKSIKFFGKIDSTVYKKIANLGQNIMFDTFFKNHFKYIFSDSLEIVIKPKKYNYMIEIGNLEMIENKLMNYKFFYATKIKGKDLEDIKTINLRYANQVIVQRK